MTTILKNVESRALTRQGFKKCKLDRPQHTHTRARKTQSQTDQYDCKQEAIERRKYDRDYVIPSAKHVGSVEYVKIRNRTVRLAYVTHSSHKNRVKNKFAAIRLQTAEENTFCF